MIQTYTCRFLTGPIAERPTAESLNALTNDRYYPYIFLSSDTKELSIWDSEDWVVIQEAQTNISQFQVSTGVLFLSGEGAPVDYTDGDPPATGEGLAAPGSMYIDSENGAWYKNVGSAAEPEWVEMAEVT